MTTNKFVIYVCLYCGRTIKWPNISTSMPNLQCSHQEDSLRWIGTMIQVQPKLTTLERIEFSRTPLAYYLRLRTQHDYTPRQAYICTLMQFATVNAYRHRMAKLSKRHSLFCQ